MQRVMRIAWLMIVLGTTMFACNFANDLGSQVAEIRNTAESVATDFDEGQDLIGTAQALATQVSESDLAQTAEAVATDIEQSGLSETAQAVITEQGPGMVETVQSFATQEAPELLQTAQALITQQSPELEQTAQALATQISAESGEAPADIPIVAGDKENFFESQTFISYFTPLDYPSVLAFYRAEMAAQGWTALDEGTIETENTAILNYRKDGRTAAVTLSINPATNQTIVLITIRTE